MSELSLPVVLGELALDVALGVAGRSCSRIACCRRRAPCRRSTPRARCTARRCCPSWRARVAGERGALRRLARGDPVAVGVQRVAEVLEVLHVHRLGELDRVVVPQHALDRDRELVVVARDVGVDVVVPVEERPVVGHLLDVGVRDVDVGDVVDPPAVVLAQRGCARPSRRRSRGSARTRWSESGSSRRGRAELDLQRRRLPRVERSVAGQRGAADGEAVAAQPRRDRGEPVAGGDRAGQLGAQRRRRRRERRGDRDRPRRRRGAGVGDVSTRDRDVVVRDELALRDRAGPVAVWALRPVARVLAALGRGLRQRRVGDRDRVQVLVGAGRAAPGRRSRRRSRAVPALWVYMYSARPRV